MRSQFRITLAFIVLIGFIMSGCLPQPTYTDGSPVLKATPSLSVTPSPVTATIPSVSQPTIAATTACTESEGELVEGSYTGVVYAQEIPFLAYLPSCYATEMHNYPIVYLLHGYPFDQTHWLDLDLVETYERGVESGRWPSVIFLLPFVPEPLFTRSDGGVGSYEQEFIEGLIPAIEAKYRVAASADQHVLGGVSRGGVWALEIGLRNSDQFKHIIAVSPSLVYNQPRPRYDPFEIVREERDFPKTLFVSAAENEAPFREDIEDFIDVLKQQGIDHSFLLHPGNHNDGTWRTVIEEILIHLLLGVSS